MSRQPKVVCFGEVLWDILPTGKVAGGAPMNVAYHTNNLGMDTNMISCIGKDYLGKGLITFLNRKNISTKFIQVNDQHKTGTVGVKLDENGSPTYEIHEPVAWDFIDLKFRDIAIVKQSDALVYGSLAARSERSRTTLFQLLETASFKMFDLNLRKPFYDTDLLQKLLSYADILKLSDEELEEIVTEDIREKNQIEQLEILKNRYQLKGVLLSKGRDGAVYLDDDGFFEHPVFPITVKDTVGSGDAFLSAFLSKYLTENNPTQCLKYGCALGAMVAKTTGATPKITYVDIDEFFQNFE